MRSIRFFLPILLGSGILNAVAQDAGVRIGETRLTPSVVFEVGASDNAFRQSEDEEVDEQFVIISPELKWRANKGLTEVQASYQGAFKAGDLEETEFTDSSISGEISTEFSKRSRIEADARLAFGHLDLGSDIFTRTDPLAFDQVEFFSQRAAVTYTFGARQARGQIIGRFLLDNLDYTNNDSVTANSGRLILSPSIEFSFRASADTRVFLSVGIDELIRTEGGNDRTSIDAVVGSRWDITGRTGGFAEIGVGRSSLDGGNDTTELTLEAGLFFEPRSFSRFDIAVERGFFDDGSGDFADAVINNELSVTWRHDYSSRVFHIADLSYQNVERTCPALDDETAEFRLEVGVQIRRWISLGLGGEIESRTNGDCPGVVVADANIAPDYDRRAAFAFLRLSL